MFKDSPAFSGFSTNDLAAARAFYQDVLGLTADEELEAMGMLKLSFATGGSVIIYQKDDHQAATYTVLNFPVDDIDEAVKQLKAKDVVFEQYEGMTGEDGIARGKAANRGPDIAWFKDPAGNILSVLSA